MMRSEGQRQLKVIVDGGVTQTEVAERIQRAGPTVSLWLSGKKLPDVVSAARLETEFGIAPRTWAEKPNGKKTH